MPTLVEELTAALQSMTAVSRHQCNPNIHPLTCGNKSSHGNLYPLYEDGIVKLICPDCDYVQGNAAMFSVPPPTVATPILESLVRTAIEYEQDGYDVLASAAWDEVREFVNKKA